MIEARISRQSICWVSREKPTVAQDTEQATANQPVTEEDAGPYWMCRASVARSVNIVTEFERVRRPVIRDTVFRLGRVAGVVTPVAATSNSVREQNESEHHADSTDSLVPVQEPGRKQCTENEG